MLQFLEARVKKAEEERTAHTIPRHFVTRFVNLGAAQLRD